jgi:integrase
VLRQSLDRAVNKGWLTENPARKVDLLREEKPEIDPLSLTEVKTFLFSGLDDDVNRDYFRVAFFSGLRPGEEIGLQWDDIDWQRRIICVRRSIGRFGKGPTKTVESQRDVGMLPVVEQALRARRAASEAPSTWVFANRSISRTSGSACGALPCVERNCARTLYQTQHTFATLMLELGESPGWVAKLLGHINAEMVGGTTGSFRICAAGTGRMRRGGWHWKGCEERSGHSMVTL